ncbi:MAG: hypothetical protein IRY83_13435 [Chloroflexi bacterium]|nr:hypothetical protein [Chloroflexota bacterium]
MTCEELRRRWLAGQLDDDDGTWSAHRAACRDCALWFDSLQDLDALIAPTVLVPVPAGLAARLREIPRAGRRMVRASPAGRALEPIAIAMLVLGFVGLITAAESIAGIISPLALATVQAFLLIVDSPLSHYAGDLVSMAVEALATLVLIAVLVLRGVPGIPDDQRVASRRS